MPRRSIVGFLIILALIIVLAVRAARSSNFGGVGTQETPLDILKKRYAKGEISKDDFDRIKKDL